MSVPGPLPIVCGSKGLYLDGNFDRPRGSHFLSGLIRRAILPCRTFYYTILCVPFASCDRKIFGSLQKGYALNRQQGLLQIQTAGVAAQSAVGGDDPVAGDEDGDRIAAVGLPHRLKAPRAACRPG